MVLVVVEDHGVGVSSEIQPTLFRPFKQAQRLTGGTGLGLFSLYKRVEALGGKCGCTDRRDGQQGSLFWFTFPYRPDDSALTATSRNVISKDAIMNLLREDTCEDFTKNASAYRYSQSDKSNNMSEVDLLPPIDRCVLMTTGTEHDEVGQNARRGMGEAHDEQGLVRGEQGLEQGGQGLVRGEQGLVQGEQGIGPSQPPSAAGLDDTATKKELLIDDTPMILKVVGRLLKANGHSVDTAVNGLHGFEKLKQEYLKSPHTSLDVEEGGRVGGGGGGGEGGGGGYDFVLSDLQMPVMDGKQYHTLIVVLVFFSTHALYISILLHAHAYTRTIHHRSTGLEFTKRFRVWEEEQQCLLDAQGMSPPPHKIYP